MSSPTKTLMKQKKADGTFEEFHPITSSDAVLIDDNNTLKSAIVDEPTANKLLKLDSTGKFPIDAIPQTVEFITYTSEDITS